MQEFNYTDKRVLHTLSTYISEGYLFPDIIKKDCKFRLISPKVIHKYKFIWSSSETQVKCKLFSKTIIVPRHIHNKQTNTKLESILHFGFYIFNCIANKEMLKRHPLTFIKLGLLNKKHDRFSINRRLISFFNMLEKANREFISVYNDFQVSAVYMLLLF